MRVRTKQSHEDTQTRKAGEHGSSSSTVTNTSTSTSTSKAHEHSSRFDSMLAMYSGDLSAVIAQLMSKCL